MNKTFRCKGCGDVREYALRRPLYCPECRKIKHYAQIQNYKKRRAPAKGDREEHIAGGRASFLTALGGATHEDIGQALGLNFRQVHRLEREALTKIRTNPELAKIWGTIKAELAEGCALPPRPRQLGVAARGEILLDCQSVVMDWTLYYEDLIEAGDYVNAKAVLGCVSRFRQALALAMVALATDGRDC